MKYLWLFVPLFIIISCSKTEYKDSVTFSLLDFPETRQLKGKEILFDKELLRPVRIYLTDSVLVFQNSRVETHFDKYNLHTKKKIGECISFGSGPEEMLYPKGFQLVDSVIWICDVDKRKMLGYRKEQFCYSNMPKPVHTINFNETFDQVAIKQNEIVSTVLSPDHQRLSFYGMNGLFLKTVGDFPDCHLNLTPIETIEGFLCNLLVNPDDGKVCLSYKRTDLIEFYDSNGTLIRRMHGPDHFFPVIMEDKRGNGVGIHSIERQTRDAYFCPVAVNNMIYLLYSGKFFDLKDTKDSYLLNQIFVFDWDGNPLKRYILDTPVFWFTIDARQKRIYGLTDSPDYRVIEFQI